MTNQSIGPAELLSVTVWKPTAWLPEVVRRVDAGETIDDSTFAILPERRGTGAEPNSQTRAAGPTAGL